MKIKKPAKAGTYESNDVYIMVFPHDGIKIDLESVVFETFGDEIRQVIVDTLKSKQVTDGYVRVIDKGALNFTIKARLLTALQRGGLGE